MPFNDSVATSIANASKNCGFDEFTDKYLTFPPSGQQPDVCQQPGINADCTNYLDGCDVFDTAFNALFEINPGFNICRWHSPALKVSLRIERFILFNLKRNYPS